MDRGKWWATIQGVAESDMTEQLTQENYSSTKTTYSFLNLLCTKNNLLITLLPLCSPRIIQRNTFRRRGRRRKIKRRVDKHYLLAIEFANTVTSV